MRKPITQWILEAVTVGLILISMWVTIACEKGTEPDRSNCGSGNVTWDAKAGVCRDLADNHIVPNSCCGR